MGIKIRLKLEQKSVETMTMSESNSFSSQLTADGSFTFFSEEFKESFHSHQGAKLEAELKFVQPLQLREKAKQPSLKILDVCYGLGYNTAASLAAIHQVNPHCVIEWVGLELNPEIPRAAVRHQFLDLWPSPIPTLLDILARDYTLESDWFKAQLIIGDGRKTLPQLVKNGFQADGILLDPFSPPVCPQLWSVEFLSWLARCLKPEGLIVTYSCAASVRTALILAGLQIASTVPVGRRSPGTVAGWGELPGGELSQEEQEHLQTRAAIPYRDPTLNDPTSVILQRREDEQKISCLEPTSHWKKRWQKLNQSPIHPH